MQLLKNKTACHIYVLYMLFCTHTRARERND